MPQSSLIDQYTQIHATHSWGNTSVGLHSKYIQLLLQDHQPQSILDFGCGQSKLAPYLQSQIESIKQAYRYDPSIPEIKNKPKATVDWVLNTDVLEHIPEEQLDDILTDIKSLSNKVIFMIHLKEATLILPNGQNAHCTIKPPVWWQNKINQHFSHTTLLGHHSGKHCCIVTQDVPLKNRYKYSILKSYLFIIRCFKFIYRKVKQKCLKQN